MTCLALGICLTAFYWGVDLAPEPEITVHKVKTVVIEAPREEK